MEDRVDGQSSGGESSSGESISCGETAAPPHEMAIFLTFEADMRPSSTPPLHPKASLSQKDWGTTPPGPR